MADATYQPKIYRSEGGDKLTAASGGSVVLESGSSVSVATDLEIASGGRLVIQSGGSIAFSTGSQATHPVQTAATTATVISAIGLTVVEGTTAGPTFLIANPITGQFKGLSLTHSSSGATHRALISPASTAVSFDTTGGNQITLATSAARGVLLWGASTSSYRIVGVYSGASIAAPRTT